jgi:hypothetical protein
MNAINSLSTGRPKNGDKKEFYGKLFVYSSGAWILSEVTHNVITPKNSGSGRLYSDRLQSVR